jgi:outer membrane lipoprotein-sorting protein
MTLALMFAALSRSMPLPAPRVALCARIAFLCMLACVSGFAQAFDLPELMQNMGRIKERRGQFVEIKYLSLLNQPIESRGEVRYVAPHFFEKITREPTPDLMRIDGDSLYLERGKQKYNLRLANQPQAAAFVDAIAGLMTGDSTYLERSYRYELSGTAANWTLKLIPKARVMLDYVTEVRASGNQSQVTRVEYQQADGDRSVMTIEPLTVK